MAQAQPLELDVRLKDDLNAFGRSVTHTDAYDKVVFRRLENDCDTLQRTDVVHGSLKRAFLNSAVGNFAEVERWIKNAEHNHGKDEARIEWLTHFVNHGFASEAMAVADLAFERRAGQPLMEVAARVAAAGAFGKIIKAVQQSQENGEVLYMTNLYAVSLKAVDTCTALGVSDADIAAVLDVAGELLREHKLMWQNSLPDITILDAAQGGPTLCIAYRVDLPPDQAASLGWQLAETLIDRGLDRQGLLVDFLGTALQAKLAA